MVGPVLLGRIGYWDFNSKEKKVSCLDIGRIHPLKENLQIVNGRG